MVVRPALQQDYKGIASLIQNELGYCNETDEDIYKRLDTIGKSGSHQTLAACAGDTVVGFIGLCRAVTYETGEQITIQAFAVSDRYQRQGIGKALLSAARDYAKEHGIKIIRLGCAFHREGSQKFYEANGFEQVGFIYFMYL